MKVATGQYLETGYLPDHTVHLYHRWVCVKCPPAKVIEEEGHLVKMARKGRWCHDAEEARQDLNTHNVEVHA
jgi:hypothetical protein